MFVAPNVAERGADELTGAQAGRVTQVEQEAQALGGRRASAIRPFQPVGERADQQPLALGEAEETPSPVREAVPRTLTPANGFAIT
ncbi:hypothetical protein G5C45_00590 [Burkholderia pseudomallei]|nr:hypothetical protein [Burkholderia pseudomallei]MBD2947669.1 hypothetical protein [Burkholderia pseudomallei]MBD2984801.1 hypothetical protein [Burkholderia pseudomallei]MBD2990337.1 hypothetical protein [Burkholderia pseudomallei]MBF3420709.1 hypothetical protein [Burkholderia pseudomallei]